MLKSLFTRVRPEDKTYRLVRVAASNFRAISIYAIDGVKKPIVMLDTETVTDYSARGPLRRKRIAEAHDFEIRDGDQPVLGFHDGPENMWVNDRYLEMAEHCEKQGWLKLQS